MIDSIKYCESYINWAQLAMCTILDNNTKIFYQNIIIFGVPVPISVELIMPHLPNIPPAMYVSEYPVWGCHAEWSIVTVKLSPTKCHGVVLWHSWHLTTCVISRVLSNYKCTTALTCLLLAAATISRNLIIGACVPRIRQYYPPAAPCTCAGSGLVSSLLVMPT